MKRKVIITGLVLAGLAGTLAACKKTETSSLKTVNTKTKARGFWRDAWLWVREVVFNGPGRVHVVFDDGSFYDGLASPHPKDIQRCVETNAVCIMDVIVRGMTTDGGINRAFDGMLDFTHDGYLALAVCEDLSNPKYVANYVDQKIFNALTPIRLPAEAKTALGLPDDYVIPAGQYPIHYVPGSGFYVVFK